MAWYDPTTWFDSETTTTLPDGIEPFDTSGYWQADEQTTGSVTSDDVKSFLNEYPEYTSFFTSLLSSQIWSIQSSKSINHIYEKVNDNILKQF